MCIIGLYCRTASLTIRPSIKIRGALCKWEKEAQTGKKYTGHGSQIKEERKRFVIKTNGVLTGCTQLTVTKQALHFYKRNDNVGRL